MLYLSSYDILIYFYNRLKIFKIWLKFYITHRDFH